MIKEVPEETKADMMKTYCAPRGYEIIEKEGTTVGQYRFLTKVLFKCNECNKEFNEEWKIKSHQTRLHEGKAFTYRGKIEAVWMAPIR